MNSPAALALGLDLAHWTSADLSISALGVGGSLSVGDVEAIVGGARLPTPLEHDVLAATLNDYFVERGADHPVPYWADLAS